MGSVRSGATLSDSNPRVHYSPKKQMRHSEYCSPVDLIGVGAVVPYEIQEPDGSDPSGLNSHVSKLEA